MFKLVEERLSTAPYKIPMIGEDGKRSEATVTLKVALIDQPSLTEWVKRVSGMEDAEPATFADFMCHVLRGWDGVGGSNGKPAAPTDKNKKQFAESPGVATIAFVRWYMRLWQGQAEEEEKNSEGSPAGGRKAGRAKEAPASKSK